MWFIVSKLYHSKLVQKDVFEISQVSYAIFETNGKISVLLKPEYRNTTASDLDLHPRDSGMPFAVICDGKIIEDTADEAGIDASAIKKLVLSSKIPMKEIIIMTVNADGASYIAKKETDDPCERRCRCRLVGICFPQGDGQAFGIS